MNVSPVQSTVPYSSNLSDATIYQYIVVIPNSESMYLLSASTNAGYVTSHKEIQVRIFILMLVGEDHSQITFCLSKFFIH